MDVTASAEGSKGNTWQDSRIHSNDKNTKIWLRHFQIGVELGTPYYCKERSSLPDHFDVIAETNKQFEKEFGFSADQIVAPRPKPDLPTLMGMV